MSALSEQDLHNLAMNVAGKDLEKNGFEFLAVNSKLKKDPQFVCLKEKKLHFIMVKAVVYPHNPVTYNIALMETMKEHALKFKAKLYYAGVGLANALDYDKPIDRNEDYIVNYNGCAEL